MTENAIPILATAHHSRDNLETVLLHMLRGTGINGMSGIAPCRTFGKNLCLVRPILRMNVEEIDKICNNLNLEYVIDSTNSDTAYLRNAIRKNVAEPLIEISPNVCEAVSRFSEIALEENSFISFMAQEFISKECKLGGKIPLESFNSIHNAMKSRVLSIVFEEISGATLERVHVLDLIKLCEKAHPHSSLSLPNKFSAAIEGGELVFTANHKKTQENTYQINFSEGTFDLSNGLVLKITKDSEQSAPQKNLHSIDIKESCISCENAYFRPKADGDVILHNGMSKKIKKLYNEKKLPLDIRNSLPLLVLDGNIAWIPTVAESDILKDAKRKDGESFYRISIENRK